MKRKPLFVFAALFLFTIIPGFHLCEAKTTVPSPDIILVGSTPGGDLIKSILSIPTNTKVDFIRWNLILKNTKENTGTFTLDLNYGVGQPNTPGFINGGEQKSIIGEYRISKEKGKINGNVYHLRSSELSSEILLIKLNGNLFHLLTPGKELMTGTGGWSYTLSRKFPVNIATDELAELTIVSDFPEDTARQIIFVGRTPCFEFSREYHLTVSECLRLKWKLVLNKDPKTLQPTSYTLYNVNGHSREIQGKWAIINGTPSHPHALIYQLDPDKPDQSISLLLGDKNVAFFIGKDHQPFVGNADFSYTLNRKN